MEAMKLAQLEQRSRNTIPTPMRLLALRGDGTGKQQVHHSNVPEVHCAGQDCGVHDAAGLG